MIELPQDDRARVESLTMVERDVLVLLAKGLSNAEIGRHVFRSANTINDHTKAIFRKLDVHSRTEAAVIAAKAGLV